MKIIKVLVDEAPKRCKDCQYRVSRGWHDQLSILHKTMVCLHNGKDTDPLGKLWRPEWCPLVADGEGENHDAA